MIDKRDFFLHFNEFKKYVADAEPKTILKDIHFQKFFKAFVDRQTKRHIDTFQDFVVFLLDNGYRGWVWVIVDDNRIAYKVDFRNGILSERDMKYVDICYDIEYEVIGYHPLDRCPSQYVYEIRWKQRK